MQTPFPNPTKSNISGLILAGGQAKRLDNQDKGLICLKEKPLIEYTIGALKPQVQTLMISANRNISAYQGYGLPVIVDEQSDYPGPLAGILAGLKNMQTEWLQCVPCDNPWLDQNLVNHLCEQHTDECLVVTPRWQQGLQPVYSLIHCSLMDSLEQFLQQGHRKVQDWLKQQHPCIIDFDEQSNFSNINTVDDLTRAEQQ